MLTVMLVAAEASGDLLGAGLARALRARLGEAVRFVGVGGREMAREGVDSPFDISQLSILGLLEGLRAYPRVLRRVRETVALGRRERPDVAVLIDSWGFTLRVADGLRRAMPDIKLVKYVGPQVWASRPGRTRVLARRVDLLLSIHAFDAPYFERDGLKTVFVGNRSLSGEAVRGDGERFRRSAGFDASAPLLLLLPGSRPSEVSRLMPPFEDAARRLKLEIPKLEIALLVAPTVEAMVRTLAGDWDRPPVLVSQAEKADAFAAATAALACSGTATTELGIAGVPMVVTYRVNAVTSLLARLLLRTRYITLFNIAAREAVAPELIQGDCTGPKLAREVGPLLLDPERAARQAAAQRAAIDLMGRGGPDPSERAADAVLALLGRAVDQPLASMAV